MKTLTKTAIAAIYSEVLATDLSDDLTAEELNSALFKANSGQLKLLNKRLEEAGIEGWLEERLSETSVSSSGESSTGDEEVPLVFDRVSADLGMARIKELTRNKFNPAPFLKMRLECVSGADEMQTRNTAPVIAKAKASIKHGLDSIIEQMIPDQKVVGPAELKKLFTGMSVKQQDDFLADVGRLKIGQTDRALRSNVRSNFRSLQADVVKRVATRKLKPKKHHVRPNR